MADRIKIRRDCRANWETVNPRLSVAELGIITDNNVSGSSAAVSLKIGDGVHRWKDLPEQYFYVSGSVVPDISGSIAHLQAEIDQLSGSLEDAQDLITILSSSVENLTEYVETINVHETYVHEQASPATEWNIVHNLDSYPSVTVLDSAGSVCEGELIYNSTNELTLRFSYPVLGTAYLN